MFARITADDEDAGMTTHKGRRKRPRALTRYGCIIMIVLKIWYFDISFHNYIASRRAVLARGGGRHDVTKRSDESNFSYKLFVKVLCHVLYSIYESAYLPKFYNVFRLCAAWAWFKISTWYYNEHVETRFFPYKYDRWYYISSTLVKRRVFSLVIRIKKNKNFFVNFVSVHQQKA